MMRAITILVAVAIIGCAGNRDGGGAGEFSVCSIAGRNWQLARMELDSERCCNPGKVEPIRMRT